MIIVDKFVDPFTTFKSVDIICFQADYLHGLNINLYEILAKACGTTKQRAKERFFGYIYGERGNNNGSAQQEEDSQELHLPPA